MPSWPKSQACGLASPAQGRPDFVWDRMRSIPLAQFVLPLARVPGVRLISLQKGFGTEQIAAVDFPVLDLSDRLDETSGPLMDTAAVIANLDLVLSCDTSLAHLAGALGAPVWLALHYSADWRYLRNREDSPWYPTMWIFRQSGWDAAMRHTYHAFCRKIGLRCGCGGR